MLVSGIKFVASVGTTIGASAIASEGLKRITPTATNKALKICIRLGSFAIGSAVATAAQKEVLSIIDDVSETVYEIKNRIKESKKETAVEAE